MPKPTLWRVRVLRSVEEWVEVQANTPTEAENKAGVLPRVTMVFGRSAIPAVQGEAPQGPLTAME